MEIMIWQKGLCFKGKVHELMNYLNSLPKEQTLADFLLNQLH